MIVGYREMFGASVNTAWNKADLIFLMDALSHGMAEASVARFLGRSEDEVRDRAKVVLKRRKHPNKRLRKPDNR
jgi:hypothetical protein